MDTRTKIVDAAEAARIAEAGATIVSGYFDPLLAAHAERLAAVKRPSEPLLVIIATPPDPILGPLSRAQLVAGLTVVDYVCVERCTSLAPHVSLEQEHSRLFLQLIDRVHARQGTAS